MPSPQGPLLPRRRLGAELDALRGDRTLDEVAAETLISTSKLSRLENGQGVPQPRDIRDLINFYEADRTTSDRIRRWMNEGRRQAWWREYSDVMPRTADVFFDYESGASVIRIYCPMVLPGLLQTEAYATPLLMATPYPHYTARAGGQARAGPPAPAGDPADDDDDATRLHGRDRRGRRCSEPWRWARRRRARPALHLREVSRRRNVSIRILPLDAGLHAGVMGIFTVFQFSDDIDRDVVHVETHSGDRYLEEQSQRPGISAPLRRRLPPSARQHQSRDLLTRLVEAPPQPEEKRLISTDSYTKSSFSGTGGLRRGAHARRRQRSASATPRTSPSHLTCSLQHEWHAFVAGVRAGEFDLPAERLMPVRRESDAGVTSRSSPPDPSRRLGAAYDDCGGTMLRRAPLTP